VKISYTSEVMTERGKLDAEAGLPVLSSGYLGQKTLVSRLLQSTNRQEAMCFLREEGAVNMKT
jgi:hypothetical protein